MTNTHSNSTAFDPRTITRPVPALLTYYFVLSLLALFGFPFVMIPRYLRYITLHYRFDDKGIAMSWGVLFKKEIYLTYRRIQDIQVTRNIVHRWLGLAEVAIQTASGQSSAEMTLEGIHEPEKLRDFLYLQMRGARDDHPAGEASPRDQPLQRLDDSLTGGDEALALLREIRDELRALRPPARS